jgi:hypothetical protein
MKFAFIHVNLNVCFVQSLQYLFDMLYVIFFIVVIHQYVIKIRNYEFVQIFHERVVHGILKCRRFIDQLERHYQIFVRVVFCFKNDEILVFFRMHSNSIERMTDINFNNSSSFEQFSNRLCYKRYEISILFYDSVQFAIIDAKT